VAGLLDSALAAYREGSIGEGFPELGQRTIEVVGDLDGKPTERWSLLPGIGRPAGHQPGERLATAGDDDLLAGLAHVPHQERKVLADFRDIELLHGFSSVLYKLSCTD
jgi:hypothetical protein